jgi:hypothetical protein
VQSEHGEEPKKTDSPPQDWSAQTRLLRELPWESLAVRSVGDVEVKIVAPLTKYADTLSRASGQQPAEWLEAVNTMLKVLFCSSREARYLAAALQISVRRVCRLLMRGMT